MKYTLYISILILLCSCNLEQDKEPVITEALPNVANIPQRQKIDFSDEIPHSPIAILHLDLWEFESEKLDSAIVDVILRPLNPDTFKRGFVIDYHKSEEGTYVSLPIVDSLRKAHININALNYKGYSKDVIFYPDDTVSISKSLRPLYPDSTQQVILDGYNKWVKVQNEKIKDYPNIHPEMQIQ